VVGLRPDAIPEAAEAGSHSAPMAEAAVLSVQEVLAKGAERTMLGIGP
jgi:hypothetical protein